MYQSLYIPIAPLIPIPDSLFDDINVSILSSPGATGPQGATGPIGLNGATGATGPAGTLSDVPVTLIDQATYSPSVDEYFLGIIYDGTVTITLPSSTLGKIYIIKDSVGDANTYPITVLTTGSTIDTLTSYVMSTPWGSISLVYNGIEWNVV